MYVILKKSRCTLVKYLFITYTFGCRSYKKGRSKRMINFLKGTSRINSKIHWLTTLGVIAAVAAAGVWWSEKTPSAQFTTMPIARGDVVRTVITSGTVNPVVVVQVGSYVS